MVRYVADPFSDKRGIRQRADLSPVLFLDDLLTKLSSAGRGILAKEVYLGSTCHADNLRSVTLHIVDLYKQKRSCLLHRTIF